jgi:hypothetical protein
MLPVDIVEGLLGLLALSTKIAVLTIVIGETRRFSDGTTFLDGLIGRRGAVALRRCFRVRSNQALSLTSKAPVRRLSIPGRKSRRVA